MIKVVSSKRRVALEADRLRRPRETTSALVAILGAQTAVEYMATYLIKEPMLQLDVYWRRLGSRTAERAHYAIL